MGRVSTPDEEAAMGMGMFWHRPLTPEDVSTANRIAPQHVEYRGYCSSATHLINAPVWPCEQALWARRTLDAEQRGEIQPTPEGSE